MKHSLLVFSIYFLLANIDVTAQKCFSIGSSMTEARSVQGTPSSILGSGEYITWMYGFSSISFENGRVTGYSNIGNNLKICSSSSKSDNKDCFTIGSSMSEARSVQGTPSSVLGSGGYITWMYGFSSISFENGKVTGYSNIGNNLKICSSSSKSDNKDCFTIGSSMSEARSVQGTPSSVLGSGGYITWMYGFSSISFENGKVTGYSNIGDNLRICSE